MKIKVKITDLREKLLNILIKYSFTKEEAEVISLQYLDAELRGKRSHGIGKFCVESTYFKERKNKPIITKDNGVLVLVNANKEVGQLSAQYCVDLVIKRARKYGTAIVAIYNTQRYGILDTWVRKIAEKDFLGIVINSCEPATTAYGGTTPIMGTNPLAFAVPTLDMPIVIDMATSKAAMGTMWQARREKVLLPNKTFLDKYGRYTKNPEEVFAVEHFDEYKGFAINLMVEIMSGSLIGAKMGLEVGSFYDIGYCFQAIDPSFFQPINEFKRQNTELIRQIKKSKKRNGFEEIFLPGEKSERLKQENLKSGYLEILKETWNILNCLDSNGEN